MGCPAYSLDPVGDALQRCPFLSRVSAEQGEAYARRFAANPRLPASSVTGRRPIFEETSTGFESVLRMFHGPSGVVPLTRFAEPEQHLSEQKQQDRQTLNPSVPSEMPAARRVGTSWGLVKDANALVTPSRPNLVMNGSASIGIARGFGAFPGGDGHGKPRRAQRRAKRSSNPNSKPNKSTGSTGETAPSTPSTGGKCPLRGLMGPLGGLIALPGKMKCPPAICAMRAAVARTQAVRHLRPHALPVKFAAVSAFTAAVNLPCGAWRENFEKFSPGWFLAVHLSIPVVGMLRKALLMPPYAVAITLAAAIAGQQMGAKLERHRRMRHAAFVTFTPELAASYGSCPVLPPLSRTPPNPDFSLGADTDWRLASQAAKPAGLALIRAGLSAANSSNLSPLSLSIPVV